MTEQRTVICFRCKKPWLPWRGSALPCHARCFFAPEVQDDLYLLKQLFPLVSIGRMAADFGVSTGVMRASLCAAAERVGRIVSRWGH